MAYQEQEWHDKPATDTPIDSTRLLHMESGIAGIDSAINDILARLDTLEGVVYNGDPIPVQSGGGGSGLDTTPPSQTGQPQVTLNYTQLIVTWSAATDDASGIALYHVEFSTDGGTTWTEVAQLDGSLLEYDDVQTAGTSCTYRVAAEDGAGNIGDYSAPSAPVTTVAQPAGTDSIPPTVPGTPTLAASDSVSLTIGWAASTDDHQVSGYRIDISLDGGTTWQYETFWGVSKGLQYQKTGLTSGQNVGFRLWAKDASGNTSAYCAPAFFTVPGAPNGGGGGNWVTHLQWNETDAGGSTPMAKWNFYQGWSNQSEGPTDKNLPNIQVESGEHFLRLPMVRKQGWATKDANGAAVSGYGWYGSRGDMPGSYGLTTCRVTATLRMDAGSLDKNAWMLWPDPKQGSWPENGEIDMQEIMRADRQAFKVTLHDKSSAGKNVQSSANYQMDCTQWHTLRCTRIVGAGGTGYSCLVEVDLLDGHGYRQVYLSTDPNFVKSTRMHVSFAVAFEGGVFNDDNRKATNFDIKDVLIETPA
jgi:hypothetical protein